VKKYRFQVVESRDPFKNSADLWLLKQLKRGQVDIGASTILITHDRVGLAEYTVAVEKFRYFFVYPFGLILFPTLFVMNSNSY
jgi:hypothetical protein